MKSDADIKEIHGIIEAANALQRRLDKLAARRTFGIDQQRAVRAAADKMRDIRGWGLAILLAAFDDEYAEKMKKLTIAAKRGGLQSD